MRKLSYKTVKEIVAVVVDRAGGVHFFTEKDERLRAEPTRPIQVDYSKPGNAQPLVYLLENITGKLFTHIISVDGAYCSYLRSDYYDKLARGKELPWRDKVKELMRKT